MRQHIAYALSALALTVGLSASTIGCADKDIIDPVIEIPKECSVVVVPFKDQDFPSGFDSPRGWDLAKKITGIFKSKDEFKVKNLKNVLDKLYQDGDADPSKLTVKDVAKLTKADYVVTGTITHWQLRDDDVYSPDLLRGSSTLSITIYETASATAKRLGDKADPDEVMAGHGINAVEERPVTALFPQEFGMQEVGSYTLKPDAVEAGLRNATATHVAWLLLSHSKDEEKLSGGR